MLQARHISNLTLIIAGLLFFDSPAFAKDNTMSFGFKGGVPFSTFWGTGAKDFQSGLEATPSTTVDPEALITGTGGIYLNYQLLPGFISFEPELLWLRSGKLWKVDVPGEGTDGVKIFSDYLALPLLGKMSVPLQMLSPIVPSIYAGPQVSLKFNSEARDLSGLPAADRQFTAAFLSSNITGQVRPVDVGIATGVGFDISPGSGMTTVGLDLRYNVGFVNVFNSSVTSMQFKNQSLEILGTVGVNF